MDLISVSATLKILKKRFPNPGAMELGTPYQTIMGVILSARTRDEQVLKLLPGFFKAFPNVEALASATESEIRSKINTIGMYKQKAKHMKQAAIRLRDVFQGEVPRTMEELVSLPGVGRKTASVVLASCFGIAAIAVDTHVHRVTNRLGWVKTTTPEKTEHALLALIPKKMQRVVNQVFVKHGRYICIPGKPRCFMCPVKDLCLYQKKNLVPPKNAKEIEEDVARREVLLESGRRSVSS